MSAIGNIAAAQSAKAIGKYNEQLAYQQAAYDRKKAAIREKVSKREHLRDKDRTHGRSFRKDNLFLTPSMYTCLSLEHR